MFHSLKSKMIIPIVCILFFTFAAILWFATDSMERLADELTEHRINVTASAISARLDDIEEKAQLVSTSVAADYSIITYLRDWNAYEDRPGARAALIQHMDALAAELGVDSFSIRDYEGRMVLRLHDLEAYNDIGAAGGAITAAFAGNTAVGFTSTPTMQMGLTSSTPIRCECTDGGEMIIGVLTAIYMLDTEIFVDSFAEIFNARVSVFLGNESIMSSATDAEGNRIKGMSLSPLAYETVLMGGSDVRESVVLDGTDFITHGLPLRGYGGDVIGAFVVGFLNDEALAARNNLQNAVMGVGLIGLVAAGGAMFLLIARLLRPLEALRRDVKNGVVGKTSKTSKDELGTIIREVEAVMQRERAAGEQLMVMLDSAPLSITLFDKDLNTVAFNREAGRVFGGDDRPTHEELYLTMPTFQSDGRKSMDVFDAGVESARKNGLHREEVLCKKRDGTIFPSEITWATVNFKGETVVVEYLRDITEIKSAEQKELEAEERAKLLLDTAPNACFFMSSQLETIWCNRTAVELFVVKKGKPLMLDGKECDFKCETCHERYESEICHAQKYLVENTMKIFVGYEKNPEQVLRFIADACLRSSREGQLTIELEYTTLYGEVFPCETQITPVVYHESLAFAVFIRDLRDIKSALGKAREANELNETILKVSPFVMNIWNDVPELVSTSPQSVKVFGLESEEHYIEVFSKLSPEYQPCGTLSSEKAPALVKKALSSDEYIKFEWMHQTLDGEPIPMEISIVRIKRHGKYFALTYAVDLRPIKAAEERERAALEREYAAAEESNRAKSKFLARMSHEVRTPITAVMGISEIELKTGNLPPRIEESLAKINSSASFLLGIVNDILDLSKIEAGKMELAQEEYLVPNLIVDIAHLHLAFLNGRDIKFSLIVDETLPVILLGDPLRVTQIVNNLLSNAFKYTEEGTVELALQCRKSQEDFIDLVISITDTGFGMTQEQLKILQNSEYTRFHEHENRFIGGTGLGIPIVNNLLTLMGAQMEVESEPGVGTKVVASIPQKIADSKIIGRETAARLQQFDEVILSSSKRFDVAPEPMPYGRVLVVDDVEANLYVSSGLLAFYELNVETCYSGFEAIEKIKQGEIYDIIFLDEMMPGITGTETMHALREMKYNEPIVALTANALIGQAEEYMREGFNGFISKPIQAKSLHDVLIKYIRIKQPPEVIKAALSAQKKPPTRHDIDRYQSELATTLRPRFARSHKDTFGEFSQSLKAGDTETAHRLAHTLKSSASLIREHALADVANTVETTLRNGRTPTAEQMSSLEVELNRALDSIGTQKPDFAAPTAPLDKKEAVELLKKIVPLIEMQNADAIDYLGELRRIPQAAELVRHIEDFDFRRASEVLRGLI
ncbi:MAG: ATP-binding protein [Defluviitaleaceae bacterium]|nr:ATP-binding protein [Defluviitaleaceae bacterium]